MLVRLGLRLLPLVLVAGCAARSDCPQPSVPPAAPSALRSPADPSAAAPHDDAPTPAAPVLVLMVRHAEKADDGTPDPPLTERGRERAACLAALLQGFSPTHLFTTPYRRNRDTLEPLAAATGLRPTVLDPKDDAAWQRALRELPPGSRAVVVGHSNSLPDLVAALGGRLGGLDPEGNHPHDEYDRLVHVVVYAPGHATSYDTRSCTTG
jgi:phosphohistidine phosphatase SixA